MYDEKQELGRTYTSEDRFFFPTNRRNLLSILSSGTLGPKETFAKYRNDIMDISKGYIPLFQNGISLNIIEFVTNNRETNYPLLVEVDLKKIPSRSLKNINRDSEQVLLVCSSILNSNMLKMIHFFSEEEREDFLSKTFGNVPMDNYEYTVSPDLFDKEQPFDKTLFSELNDLYKDMNKLRRKGLIADKVTASIALLAKNMKRSDDAIILRALIEFNTIPEETVISPDYDVLVKLINSSLIDDEELTENEFENLKLLSLLLDILIDTNPGEGWNSVDVLEKLYRTYTEIEGINTVKVGEWYVFCMKVLKNEIDMNPKAFADEADIVKRAIFFFLLRPEYDDIIRSESSNLQPGHIVRTLSLFLAGFWAGYERLANEFKIPRKYHEIFSVLRAHIINEGMGNDENSIVIETGFDVSCDVKDKEYLCKLQIGDRTLVEQKISVPERVNDILMKMKEKNYEQAKYSVFENRISYNFTYSHNGRKQPIYIDIERHIIIVSSPCVEFTQYSTYEKKFTTKKHLEVMMKENSRLKGKAYFVYEEGVNIALERRIAISNIENVDIIDIIEFVAKTADEFEAINFKQDKVQ